jgi:hypothetical protein
MSVVEVLTEWMPRCRVVEQYRYFQVPVSELLEILPYESEEWRECEVTDQSLKVVLSAPLSDQPKITSRRWSLIRWALMR